VSVQLATLEIAREKHGSLKRALRRMQRYCGKRRANKPSIEEKSFWNFFRF